MSENLAVIVMDIIVFMILFGIGYVIYIIIKRRQGSTNKGAMAPANTVQYMDFDYFFDNYDTQRLNLRSADAGIYAISNHTVQFEPSNDQQQFYLINVSFAPRENVSGKVSTSTGLFSRISDVHGGISTNEVPSIAILTLVTTDMRDSFDVRMEMYSNQAASLKQYFMLNSFQRQQLGFR